MVQVPVPGRCDRDTRGTSRVDFATNTVRSHSKNSTSFLERPGVSSARPWTRKPSPPARPLPPSRAFQTAKPGCENTAIPNQQSQFATARCEHHDSQINLFLKSFVCESRRAGRLTLYRHVSPAGELRPDGAKLLKSQ